MESTKQTSQTIPKTGRIVQVTEFNNPKAVKVVEEEIAELKKGEVLIKIHSAPLTGFDLAKMDGLRGGVLPYVPGLEASGVIVAANVDEDLLPHILNKKVSFRPQLGSFREYGRQNFDDLIFLEEKGSEKQSKISTDELTGHCVTYVNPLTAYGLIEKVESILSKSPKKPRAVIIDSANSSVSKMFSSLAKVKNIEVVNIVRSEKRLKEMKEKYNTEHIVSSDDTEFASKLKSLQDKTGAWIALDCLSGDISTILIKTLPLEGVYVNFGTETSKPIVVDATDLRWGEKEITSFLIFLWLNKKSKEEKLEIFDYVRNNLEQVFRQQTGDVYKMSEFPEKYQELKEKAHHAAHKFVLVNDFI
jgi:NADPH:quinone reductase-like Zn-dependent oxidoreductase